MRALLAALCLLLAGCIDVQTTVRVNADGSGVVEERILMSKALTEMMREGGDASVEEGADEEQLREQAQSMGEGVELLGVEPVTGGPRAGYVARFAFADIARLRLNQNPGDKAPRQPGAPPGPASAKDEPITFSMTPGSPAALVIRLPRSESKAPASTPSSSSEPSTEATTSSAPEDLELAMNMMRKMFDGLRIAIAVELPGAIVDTNATHVEGSKVTLLELDFAALLRDADRLAKFAAADPDSVGQASALMRDLPGVKIELAREITVRFQAEDEAPGDERKEEPREEAGDDPR